ncbi:hypothetical protein AB0M92_01245 [Streptomyces sp. NPDC051582]
MSDSSVQIATVVISVAALVFSTTAAFWALDPFCVPVLTWC